MSEPEQRTICITVRMDSKHDVRHVRLLLKRLLRSYDLKCVGLATVGDETQCQTMFGATAGDEQSAKEQP